ncbi:MAG: enoyl-CoA hydratase/isomerase family protein [Deltaproteobacteria bacterium]|jgi:enoyl-CoA hydratase/carnithine racemase|nr:enoyl-CoA hydratase/isomerase family protein [Deltaproteobacteria bacterium]
MAKVEFILDEKVAVVSLNDGENRFNPEFLEAFLGVLDTIENETEARTLVVRATDEKIFCNGIDLNWLAPFIKSGAREPIKAFLFQLNDLLKRVLLYPMPTIAAITGHAFAGGAILACAFDFRFMRTDRGFFCFPEVDLNVPFLPGMLAVIKKAVPMYKFEEMQYTGKRLTAQECEAHHIVMKAGHINDLMNEVLAFAKTLDKQRMIIREMKKRLYKDIIRTIDEEDPFYISTGKLQ